MITKNMELIVEIIDLGVNGEGIAKHDGVVIFVPFALMGEKVKIHIIYAKSKFYVGKIVEIIEPSPHRTTPLCPHFKKCGGCHLQHLDYSEALNFKTNLVKNTLTKIGKVNVDNLIAPCTASQPYYYRNKFSFPIGFNDEPFVGMYKENSHQIVRIEDCFIQQPWAKTLIDVFNKFMCAHNCSVYNEETKSGLIKHLVCRMEQNQLLVCVVVNGTALPNHSNLVKMLAEHFNLFGLMININKLNNNVILTNEYKHLHGIKTIKLSDNGLNYEISLNSFMQVNTPIATAIYSRVQQEVKNEIVVNAFSGAGYLSGLLCKTAKHVYGIEIVASSHENAETLKRENKLENLTNILGDVSEKLKMIKDYSFIVLDPPRKGCSKEVIDTIINVKPKNILYISCGPATLARDLGYLKDYYSINFVEPYDMFPQTHHVETLVSLTLKN